MNTVNKLYVMIKKKYVKKATMQFWPNGSAEVMIGTARVDVHSTNTHIPQYIYLCIALIVLRSAYAENIQKLFFLGRGVIIKMYSNFIPLPTTVNMANYSLYSYPSMIKTCFRLCCCGLITLYIDNLLVKALQL